MRRLHLGASVLLLFGLFATFAFAENDFSNEYSNTTTGFRGDFTIIGNTLVTCSGRGCNPNNGGQNNSRRWMVYVDEDQDSTTQNSSRARLDLPANAQIEYAALVWGGRTENSNGGRAIKFKRPGDADYRTLSSDWTETISGYSHGDPYASYKDVTQLLGQLTNPNGDYWVADIDTKTGSSDRLGFWGGWALIVVYRDPSETSIRRITVDAGLKKVAGQSTNVDVTIQGLVTPVAGAYVTHLGVVAWEGDGGITGDALQVGPDTNHLSTLSNSVNRPNNFFNSTISHYGTYFHDKDPDYVNQFGLDADLAEITNLPNDISQVVVRFTTNGDHYYPQVLVTSVELATISGRVFEDVNGDADLGDARPVSGVTVRLYQDDGDGVPDNGDNRVRTVATTTQGKYSFQGIGDGTYWVVVDSKTVAPANGFNAGAGQGDVWAEQTYGSGGSWGGALCDDDADPSTAARPRSSNGACYGGRRGDASDDANALATAEHVARVVVSGEAVTGVDFGFSFNVVTNTNDRDDDTSANRTAQGSLRQFIQNANAITGANAMRFVPAVPRTTGFNYWRIQASRAMTDTDPFADGVGVGPVFRVTDANTTIDGTAYKFNGHPWPAPGSHAGTTAGYIKTCVIPEFESPSVEVFVPRRHKDDHGDFNDEEKLWNISNNGDDASIFYIEGTAGNFVLRKIAAYGGHYAVYIDEAEGARVEDSFLGVPASGLSDPGQGNRSNRGVVVNRVQNIQIKHNLIGYVRLHGVYFSDVEGDYAPGDVVKSGTAVIEENEVAYPSRGWWFENGIGLEGNSGEVVVRCNYVHHSGAVGIETWNSSGRHWIGQNTVEQNGLGDTEFQGGHGQDYENRRERIAVRLKAPSNVVRYNTISDNQGVGVLVVGGYARNLISKNSFQRNGPDTSRPWLAIDLLDGDRENQISRNLGDGVLANDGVIRNDDGNNGLDYPIFTLAELDGSGLHLVGYVGASGQHLTGPFAIEVYKVDDDGNNNGEVEAGDGKSVPHGEGRWYLGSCTSAANGTFDCTLTVPSGVSLAAGDAVTGITIDADGNTSEFGANKVVSVRVSGRVYEDLQPNASRDTGEDWQNGSTVYVKLVDGNGTVVQVTRVDPGDGAYHFDVVAPGDYTLIVDDNGNTANAAPTPPSGWLFVSPPDGRRFITLGTRPIVAQDFGLFHGARVLGTVFRDTGDGPGTANDAVQNGNEPGVAGVTVSVSDGSHTRTTQTNAGGHYLLYVPVGWGDVVLSHGVRPATGYNTGGSGAHQAADWADASATNSSAASVDLGAASGISGQTLAGFNFGVVYKSSFRPDQQGSATSPGTVSYAHTYRPGTQGTVVFSHAGGDYTYQLRMDANCDGDFNDASEGWQAVSTSNKPAFVVDDDWPRNPDGSFKACNVEVRVLVPGGEPEGAVDIAEVAADLIWANNGAVIDRRLIVDTTRVRILGTLRLRKLGRRVADPTMDRAPKSFPADYAASVDGAPGDVLEYCIAYTNIGSDAVTDVKISDPVPFFADALADAYGAGKAIYWKDATGAVHWLTASSDGDAGTIASGILEVRAEARLDPGEEGLVCYRVQIR